MDTPCTIPTKRTSPQSACTERCGEANGLVNPIFHLFLCPDLELSTLACLLACCLLWLAGETRKFGGLFSRSLAYAPRRAGVTPMVCTCVVWVYIHMWDLARSARVGAWRVDWRRKIREHPVKAQERSVDSSRRVCGCCVAQFAWPGSGRRGEPLQGVPEGALPPPKRAPGHPEAPEGWADRVVSWCVHQGSASALGTQPMW